MRKIVLCGFFVLIMGGAVYAEDELPTDSEFDEILSRDISELTVTSVAKRTQRLGDTAAAVYVITQEELRRSGIYTIPEALRLVPGMQVAKTGRGGWAISARGFNNSLSNKLLVLIDGRAIYTPIFSGVYWGDQGTTINDIERIEVIRGPGASIYGANAVNGVISIITKSAERTQGNMLSATTTAKGNGIYEARHGGKLGDNSYYRAFGQYQDLSNWYRGRTGFRIDGKKNSREEYTIQGDAYGGEQETHINTASLTPPFTQTLFSNDEVYGGNVLARWTKEVSEKSEINLQGYLDHYSRQEFIANQHVSTADIQFQQTLKLNNQNNFLWGAGGRLYYDIINGSFAAQVNDEYATHEILNAFVQNEYALVPDKLLLTLGSKFEYNDFTGFELQPTARFSWFPTNNQTVWGAVSRAVRTPSSIEQDVSLVASVTPSPLTEYRVVGNPDQKSEELIAYELGYRIQANHNLSFDTAFFYNDYDNLLTINNAGTPFIGANGNIVVPYMASNLGSGHVYGAELTASWNISSDWRLAGSYTYLKMNLDVEPGSITNPASTENLAPRHQFSVQSYYNIIDNVQWDNMLYYVDDITLPAKNYIRYDTRVAWLVKPGLELSFIGRNLVDPHIEFPASNSTEIDRSYIGQILWKF